MADHDRSIVSAVAHTGVWLLDRPPGCPCRSANAQRGTLVLAGTALELQARQTYRVARLERL
jgi:hypothetical protein